MKRCNIRITYLVLSQHISFQQCSGLNAKLTEPSPDGQDFTAGRFVSVGSRFDARLSVKLTPDGN